MAACAHIVVPELFLPKALAAEVCAGLSLPALEKILARAQPEKLSADSLECWLCAEFGVAEQAIAPIALSADGMEPGEACWLCADPVHLHLQRSEMILQPVAALSADEAVQLCASLNAHFIDDGLYFVAPRPQHWYLRLLRQPKITTSALASVMGRDVRAHLTQGAEALPWHRLLNEMQMLLSNHPVNLAREMRGERIVNSVWLWGGGHMTEQLLRPFMRAYSDSALVAAFAAAVSISHAPLPGDATQCVADHEGETLIVWDGLRLALQHDGHGDWRDSLLNFEQSCIHPLLQALHKGLLEKITLDVLQENASSRFVLTRGAAWKFWLPRRRLYDYALV